MADAREYVPLIVALISVLGAGVFSIWRGKDEGVLSERATYYANIRDDVDDLRARLDSWEEYIGDLEGHIDELHAIMTRAGLRPPPRPKRPRRGGAT
jgi:hypothetical protein